jgi:hypothetical protein
MQMFSPYTCNFFVPFAQKDARFGSQPKRWAQRPADHAADTANEHSTHRKTKA